MMGHVPDKAVLCHGVYFVCSDPLARFPGVLFEMDA